MIQEFNWTRYFLIFITQLFISSLFILIAYKIIKRKRNLDSILLSAFYLLVSISLIINIIYLPIRDELLIYILYFITLYFICLSFIFISLFNLNLLKLEHELSTIKNILIIIIYAVVSFLLLNYPGGITINKSSNWKPLWSWEFLIIAYIFITIVILIPNIIISIKIYRKFIYRELKRKWVLYFIGIMGFAFVLYGACLYNTWNNDFFKIIWSFLSLIVIPSGILIYFGIAKNI